MVGIHTLFVFILFIPNNFAKTILVEELTKWTLRNKTSYKCRVIYLKILLMIPVAYILNVFVNDIKLSLSMLIYVPRTVRI